MNGGGTTGGFPTLGHLPGVARAWKMKRKGRGEGRGRRSSALMLLARSYRLANAPLINT